MVENGQLIFNRIRWMMMMMMMMIMMILRYLKLISFSYY